MTYLWLCIAAWIGLNAAVVVELVRDYRRTGGVR